jgi:predicted kinase
MTIKSRDLENDDFKKTKEIFLAQIIVPERKPFRQSLLCPVGLIGAGKSTVVVPLSAELGFVRISHDEIRKILIERGFKKGTLEYSRSREIAMEAISKFLDEGYSVTIDANCGSKETIENIKKIEQKYTLEALWIHINPPEDFIVNKLKSFKHSWLFMNGDEAVGSYYKFKRIHGDFTSLGINFLYTFDTSKSNLDKQIEEARQIILRRIATI